MKKIAVGILGATGMVGQRFVALLADHPWFEIKVVAASSRSAGKSYREAIQERWTSKKLIPQNIAAMKVLSVAEDIDAIAAEVRLVFSALDLDKEAIKKLEEDYAAHDVFVISNNSAHRFTSDIPMIIPEINPEHLQIVKEQRKKRGWKTGGIVVKSNCSIQSYVPVLHALKAFEPQEVIVTTLQAISGAGKTFASWSEMVDNVIPYIGGEEEKSEQEPLKIWGTIMNGEIQLAKKPTISATCMRVAVADGHMASVSVKFGKKVTKKELITAITNYNNPIAKQQLPSAPKVFLRYCAEADRPQTKLDRDFERGMGISIGRIREDHILDYRFVALSHNTIRGAAGGAVLAAELVKAEGYLK